MGETVRSLIQCTNVPLSLHQTDCASISYYFDHCWGNLHERQNERCDIGLWLSLCTNTQAYGEVKT